MMCECRSVDFNKCTSRMWNADTERLGMGRRGGAAGGIWEFSVFPTQLFCEPKTVVKTKPIKNKTTKNSRRDACWIKLSLGNMSLTKLLI